MISLTPFTKLELDTMPEVVKTYIGNGHFGGTLKIQRQLLLDYEEDITAYCLQNAELPLKGNYDAANYKIYYHDTGVVGEMLIKSGYEQLYFYKHDSPSLEMDFFVRDADSLIPIEVKANDGATASLNNLIGWPSYPDIMYGIK